MAGSFQVLAFPTDTPTPDTIAFRGIENVTAAPGDIALAASIGSDIGLVSRVVAEVYGEKFRDFPEFRNAYQAFLAAAKAGVQHPNGDRRIGETAQRGAREQFIQQVGRRYRDLYLTRVARISVFLAIAGLLLCVATFIDRLVSVTDDILRVEIYARALAISLVGIALSFYLGTYLYLQQLTWNKLDFFDPNGLRPQFTIVTIVIITVIMMALLDYDAIVVGIGPITLNHFKEPGVAFLLGILCGLSQVQVIKLIRDLFERAPQQQQPAHP